MGFIVQQETSNFGAVSMNFKLDAGSTSVLFLDFVTGATLEVQSTNTIQAVANGVNIRVQLNGGEKILIDALELATISINGVQVTQVQATAINELNALYANVGISGNAPTINPASISLTPSQSINFTPTGTDVVTWTYDSLPVGIVSVEGQHKTIIGGSSLVVGVYNIIVRATNYYGSVTETIVLTVAIPPFSNTKSFLGNSSGTNFFRKNTAGQENNIPLYRPGGPTGYPWTIFGWQKSSTAGSGFRGLFSFGGDFSGSDGGVYLFYRQLNASSVQLGFQLGNSTGYIRAFPVNHWHSPLDWFSWAVVYDGTSTNDGTVNSIKVYINGGSRAITPYVAGTGYNGSIEYLAGNDDSQFHLARCFTQVIGTGLSTNVNSEDVALWNSDQSANIATFHNSGTPLDLSVYNPSDYFRFGDAPLDISGYPALENVGTGDDLTAFGGTVADYVSDTP